MLIVSELNIRELLPHREPFLFLDKIISCVSGESISVSKQFDKDEYFFSGHFPGYPIVPGAIISEAIAQACCVLFCVTYGYDEERLYALGKLRMNFLNSLYPQQNMIININAIKLISSGGFFKAVATHGNIKLAEGQFSMSVKKVLNESKKS